jgi:hypothetical protein
MSVSPTQVPARRAAEDWNVFHCLEELSRISEMTLVPAEYYKEFLSLLLKAMSGAAAAVWLQGKQGGLQLQGDLNLVHVGLATLDARKGHESLLRHVQQKGQALRVPPNYVFQMEGTENKVLGNSTDFELLLAPIGVDGQVIGLIEVWRENTPSSRSLAWWLQFLVRVGSLVSLYCRNNERRQLSFQKRLWEQLEFFSQQIHGSLNPSEVANLLANEGRRLLECDRLSVAIRWGTRTSIVAVSGADVIEKRSSLIQRMRILTALVMRWGEKLTYTGSKDPGLPPDVFPALDAYLELSNTRILVVLPLRDEMHTRKKDHPSAALIMESFKPDSSLQPMMDRLEVIGRHSTSALLNAMKYRRIPMRWLWQPLVWFQDELGGPQRLLGVLTFLFVVAISCVLYFGTCVLTTEARGQLLPCQRRWVYAPIEGQIVHFDEKVRPGAVVSENQSLILMYDVQLANHLIDLNHAIAEAHESAEALSKQEKTATTEIERLRISAERQQQELVCERKMQERKALRNRTNAEDERPGYFWIKSPLHGSILNADFSERLDNRYVKPSEPLLRIGDKEHDWEIELMIPQSRIGHIIRAFTSNEPEEELDVDVLLACAPTRTFQGKLARWKIGSQATARLEDPHESEPMVHAFVRIDDPRIMESDRVPSDLRITGTEVRCKIHCGHHRLSYSLFYGLWEFFYEKVVFLF